MLRQVGASKKIQALSSGKVFSPGGLLKEFMHNLLFLHLLDFFASFRIFFIANFDEACCIFLSPVVWEVLWELNEPGTCVLCVHTLQVLNVTAAFCSHVHTHLTLLSFPAAMSASPPAAYALIHVCDTAQPAIKKLAAMQRHLGQASAANGSPKVFSPRHPSQGAFCFENTPLAFYFLMRHWHLASVGNKGHFKNGGWCFPSSSAHCWQ